MRAIKENLIKLKNLLSLLAPILGRSKRRGHVNPVEMK